MSNLTFHCIHQFPPTEEIRTLFPWRGDVYVATNKGLYIVKQPEGSIVNVDQMIGEVFWSNPDQEGW